MCQRQRHPRKVNKKPFRKISSRTHQRFLVAITVLISFFIISVPYRATMDTMMESTMKKMDVALQDRKGDNITAVQPISNVLLMGQFNYDTPSSDVEKWVTIWSKYFASIVVAGPFSDSHVRDLRKKKIKVLKGRNDAGWVSPTENLMNALLQHSTLVDSSKRIDAVLYAHDDCLLNLRFLNRTADGRATEDSIVASYDNPSYRRVEAQGMNYFIDLHTRTWEGEDGTSEIFDVSHSFRMFGDESNVIEDLYEFERMLEPWHNNLFCLKRFLQVLYVNSMEGATWLDVVAEKSIIRQEIVADSSLPSSIPKNATITTATRTFYFPGFGQSDFLYVPTRYAGLFEYIAQPFIENRVFLECAIPTIVEWMPMVESRKAFVEASYEKGTTFVPDENNAVPTPSLSSPLSFHKLKLCTSWNDTDRKTVDGILKTFYSCYYEDAENSMVYHPVKMGLVGPDVFSDLLDTLQS